MSGRQDLNGEERSATVKKCGGKIASDYGRIEEEAEGL